MKNFNFNMGRYYAWSNLSQSIKAYIKKQTFTPYYTMQYVPPKIDNRFKYLPYDDWAANKTRDRSYLNVVLMAVAFLTYTASKFVYQILHDEDKGYYYHVHYPILCKSIELIYADVQNYTTPFFEIIPKNRFQITQIYPRLYELIFQTQKRIAQKDEKVHQLRAEIEQYDKKYK